MALGDGIARVWSKLDKDTVKIIAIGVLAIVALGASIAFNYWLFTAFSPMALMIGGTSLAMLYYQAGNIAKSTRNALIAASLLTGLAFSVFLIAPAALTLLSIGGLAPLTVTIGFLGFTPFMLVSAVALFAGLLGAYRLGDYLYQSYGSSIKNALNSIPLYPASSMGVFYTAQARARDGDLTPPGHFPSPLASPASSRTSSTASLDSLGSSESGQEGDNPLAYS